MASSVRPVTATRAPAVRAWRRVVQVLVGALLVIASVAAQAVDLTPVAIVLVIAAIVALAPLALPAVDQ
jgi:hypothetical protein